MAWGKNGTPDTLTGTASQVQITDLAGNKFNQFMRNELKSASMTVNTIFNNDTGNLYAYRISYSGGADGTPSVSQPKFLESTGNDVGQEFHIMYSCWVSGEEKLVIDFGVESNTSSASTIPTRSEFAGKYVPSSLTDTCDRIDGVASTSTLAISSNLSALGSDLTPAVASSVTISDGAIFYETDTNKSYVLYNGSWTEL